MDGSWMGVSWADMEWSTRLDLALLAIVLAAACIALLGLLQALFAPHLLRRWPFRFGSVRRARSRPWALLEFSLWLLWSVGMAAGALKLRPAWGMVVVLLAMLGIVVMGLVQRSRPAPPGG